MADDKDYRTLLKAIKNLKGEMPKPSSYPFGEPSEEATRLNQANSGPDQPFPYGPNPSSERKGFSYLPREATGYRGESPFNAGELGRQAAKYPLVEQMAALPAYSYEYKPEQAMESGKFGRYVGPMAQDMERLPAVKDTVQMGPDNLRRVDTGQLTMTNTAAISEMARKMKELEGYQDLINAIRGPKRASKPDTVMSDVGGKTIY